MENKIQFNEKTAIACPTFKSRFKEKRGVTDVDSPSHHASLRHNSVKQKHFKILPRLITPTRHNRYVFTKYVSNLSSIPVNA